MQINREWLASLSQQLQQIDNPDVASKAQSVIIDFLAEHAMPKIEQGTDLSNYFTDFSAAFDKPRPPSSGRLVTQLKNIDKRRPYASQLSDAVSVVNCWLTSAVHAKSDKFLAVQALQRALINTFLQEADDQCISSAQEQMLADAHDETKTYLIAKLADRWMRSNPNPEDTELSKSIPVELQCYLLKQTKRYPSLLITDFVRALHRGRPEVFVEMSASTDASEQALWKAFVARMQVSDWMLNRQRPEWVDIVKQLTSEQSKIPSQDKQIFREAIAREAAGEIGFLHVEQASEAQWATLWETLEAASVLDWFVSVWEPRTDPSAQSHALSCYPEHFVEEVSQLVKARLSANARVPNG